MVFIIISKKCVSNNIIYQKSQFNSEISHLKSQETHLNKTNRKYKGEM